MSSDEHDEHDDGHRDDHVPLSYEAFEQYEPRHAQQSSRVCPPRIPRMTGVVCGIIVLTSITLICLPLLLLPTGFGVTNLDEAVTAEQVVAHLRTMQTLVQTEQYQGSRSLRYGYNSSRDYVLEVLAKETNFKVTQQHFYASTYEVVGTPTLSVRKASGEVESYVLAQQFSVAEYSGTGTLTNAPITVATDDGCTPSTATGKAGVLLVQRGNCPFLQKAQNAIKQGYSGVLIYNNIDGNVPSGTLTTSVSAVVFLMNKDSGDMLTEMVGAQVSMHVEATSTVVGTTNICADSGGSTDTVIVAGSHLDSVDAGPGMNDNGSGSASNLVLATHFSRLKIGGTNTVRFCWWAAEEKGLKGARYYVSEAQRTGDIGKIAVALNYDMLGSPNYRWGIYNTSGDLSTSAVRGSLVVQKLLRDYFELTSTPYSLVPLSGRSDYQPFFEAGIPIAGLETGAEGIKSVAERDLFGGSANVAYDSCYHQSCDTVGNVNKVAVHQNIKALAHLLQTLSNKVNLRDYLNAGPESAT